MDFVTVNPLAAAMAVNVGTFGTSQAFIVANTELKAPELPEKKEIVQPPLVTNVTPREASIDISPDTNIVISYNADIEIADGNLITLQDITKKNPTNVEIEAIVDGKDLIVAPTASLTANHVYKVVAGIGAIARADDATKLTKKAEVSTFEISGNANPPQRAIDPNEFEIK